MCSSPYFSGSGLPQAENLATILCNIAIAVAQTSMPSSTPLIQNSLDGATDQPAPLISTRNRWSNTSWTPTLQYSLRLINEDKLALELVNHPKSSFANNLINVLQCSTHIGYLGPHKPLVSCNLTSAPQHPDFVSENLNKCSWEELQVPSLPTPT